jgi:hypothetical protein
MPDRLLAGLTTEWINLPLSPDPDSRPNSGELDKALS